MARPAKTKLEKAVKLLNESIDKEVERPNGKELKSCIDSIKNVLEVLQKDETKKIQEEYEKKLEEIEKLQKEAENFREQHGLEKKITEEKKKKEEANSESK